MSRILKTWERWSKEGLHLPFAHDAATGKPSVTLLFPYITFVLAFVSVILLHIWPSMIVATTTSLIFWATSTIFYMLRKLTKAKIDFDDGSLDLTGVDE